MKITKIRLGRISVPLRVPFKTALRRVDSVEDIIVEIHTDEGAVGYGEAPPTGVITGDTAEAIIGAIRGHIAPVLLGRDMDDFEEAYFGRKNKIIKQHHHYGYIEVNLDGIETYSQNFNHEYDQNEKNNFEQNYFKGLDK